MNKKMLSLILIILSVFIFAGCCMHSEWLPATCESPKTCAECGKTKGEALEHVWMDATTEKPKTCSTCGTTTGERIITDPRFTTASTAALQGNWVTHISVPGSLFGFEDFQELLHIKFLVQFQNDGSMGMDFTVTNNQQFTTALVSYLHDSLYAEFAGEDMDQAAMDEAIMATYGMTADQYINTITNGLDFGSIISMLNSVTGVYYVQDNQFFSGIGWDSNLEPSAYTLNEDTLVIQNDFTGLTDEPLAFTLVTE